MLKALVIATPCYDGKVSLAFMDSMMQLQRVCDRMGIHLRWLRVNHMTVDLARDKLASDFLQQVRADVLLFIDSDQRFLPRAAIETARQAIELDVVAAACPMKSISWADLAHASKEIPEELFDTLLPQVTGGSANFVPVRPADPLSLTEPVEAGWVGSGFLAIHRRVFARLAASDQVQPYRHHDRDLRNFFQAQVKDGHWLSEDMAFCHRWRAIGGRCWVTLGHIIGHVGEMELVSDWALRAALGLDIKNM